jgi:hypothetical protein
MGIRRATRDDAPRMAELAERKREQYAPHSPPFHTPAPNAREAHEPFLAGLTEQDNFLVLVHESAGEVDGFIVTMIGPAPPVYDIGGLSSLVDDFAVATPDLWPTVGRDLLREARRIVSEGGAKQTLVVCGPHDLPKRDLSSLRACRS